MIWAASSCGQRSAHEEVKGGEVCPLSHHGVVAVSSTAKHWLLGSPSTLRPWPGCWFIFFIGKYPVIWVRSCLGKGRIHKKCVIP